MGVIGAAAMGRKIVHPVRLRSSCRLPRAVSWLELFFDLIFVAAVAQLASPLAQEYSVQGLLRFSFFFLLVWWAWLDHTLFYSRFHVDDWLQKTMTVAQIFAAAVMAANAKAELSSRDAAGFGAAYAALRVILMLQYVRARRLHESRMVRSQIISLAVSAMVWLIAAVVPVQVRYAIWMIGLLHDAISPWLRRRNLTAIRPDTAHLPERFGLFTTILLGEFVAAIMRGMEAQESWPPLAVVAAFSGFAIAFVCWWAYFEYAEAGEPHSIPQIGGAFCHHVWAYLHLPLYISLVLTGVGVEHVIAGRRFAVQDATLVASSVLALAGTGVLFSRLSSLRRLVAYQSSTGTSLTAPTLVSECKTTWR